MSSLSDRSPPSDDSCVLNALLDIRAREIPDKPFAVFEDGAVWTYAQTLDVVRRTAQGLVSLGVRAGDYVNVWMPNGADAVRVWFAINYLGAVYVPVNVAYRGRILEHVIANTQARLIIVHAGLAERLLEIDRARLSDAVVLGGKAQCIGRCIGELRVHDAEVLSPSHGDFPERTKVRSWDTQMVIYTSGTTGPSKGVISSYAHLYSTMNGAYPYLGPDDRILVNLPLFHLSGAGPVLGSLYCGGAFAMVSAFRTHEFWDVVREMQCTSAILLGVMVTFLLKQPQHADERAHTLRSVMIAPLTEAATSFARRFGVNIYTAYSMTEISSPFRAGPNPTAADSCGRQRPGVEIRLVDENDCEVPEEAVGELIVRTDAPWAMTSGYLRDPAATAAAWRNGWFHTGDAFRRDSEGNFFFVDRMKDAIRRRGENISSFEVECEVLSHPLVREAAAIAVPAEFGDDEVLVAASLQQGQVIDPAELIRYLAARMPHFMVPRYVRFVHELPRTPSHKIMKHVLRIEGVTSDTFDREVAGIVVKATKL